MKLLYCAFKPHYKSEKDYYTNGSFPDFLPRLSQYFDKIYLMVPIAKYMPKGMTKLEKTSKIEVIESNLFQYSLLNKIQHYTWSFSIRNIWNYIKYQQEADRVLIAIPSSIMYLAYIPFIKKPLITLIAGDEQEVLKNSNNIILRIECMTGFSKIRELLERYLAKKSEVIICRSYQFKKKIANNYNIDENVIHVVTSGVKTDVFKPWSLTEKKKIREELRLKNDSIVIGFVAAKLSYQKGVDLLIKAFDRLKKNYPKIELLLIGEEELKIEKNEAIVLCGSVKKEELPKYYNSMDIFIFPSRSEGAPKVVMEACSCGIPTIATNIGGIPELIKNEETGYIVDLNNIELIETYCIRLIEDNLLRKRISQASREYAVTNFDFETLCKNFYLVVLNNEKLQ